MPLSKFKKSALFIGVIALLCIILSFLLSLAHPLGFVTLRYSDSNYKYMPIIGRVYYLDVRCVGLCTTNYIELSGVNSKDFTTISRAYGRSSKYVYNRDQVVRVRYVESFKPVEGTLNKTTGGNPYYFIDDNDIWFDSYPSPTGLPILEAETNFKVLNFSIFSKIYLVSNKRVFVEGAPIPSLDPQTAEIVMGSKPGSFNEWLKDNKNVFVNNLRILGAYPDTIVLPEDKNPMEELVYDEYSVYYTGDWDEAQSKNNQCRNALLSEHSVCDVDYRLPDINPSGLTILEPVGWGKGRFKTNSGIYEIIGSKVNKISQ